MMQLAFRLVEQQVLTAYQKLVSLRAIQDLL
jgi:hypothetical protein